MTSGQDEFADERLEDIGIVVYWTGQAWRFKPIGWPHQIPYSPGYDTRTHAIASAYAYHVSDERAARP